MDYDQAYFDHPNLDKFHGYSTFKSLKNIKKKLKTNAQTATSDLGGGKMGHLGLVLTPE